MLSPGAPRGAIKLAVLLLCLRRWLWCRDSAVGEEGWLHSPAAGWDEDKYVQFPVLTRISYVGNNSRCSSSSCTSGTKEANAWRGAVRADAFTMGLISPLFSPRKKGRNSLLGWMWKAAGINPILFPHRDIGAVAALVGGRGCSACSTAVLRQSGLHK